MFSKKMMIRTLVSLLISLSAESLLSLPASIYTPLLIIGGIFGIIGLYGYSQGRFTQEKIMEIMERHQEDPLARMHKQIDLSHEPIHPKEIHKQNSLF